MHLFYTLKTCFKINQLFGRQSYHLLGRQARVLKILLSQQDSGNGLVYDNDDEELDVVDSEQDDTEKRLPYLSLIKIPPHLPFGLSLAFSVSPIPS